MICGLENLSLWQNFNTFDKLCRICFHFQEVYKNKEVVEGRGEEGYQFVFM